MQSPRYKIETTTFTPCQANVVLWLAEGKTQREIALMFGVTYQAIERHLSNLKAKLKAITPAEVVALSFASGHLQAKSN